MEGGLVVGHFRVEIEVFGVRGLEPEMRRAVGRALTVPAVAPAAVSPPAVDVRVLGEEGGTEVGRSGQHVPRENSERSD